jgi:hypothetical protein
MYIYIFFIQSHAHADMQTLRQTCTHPASSTTCSLNAYTLHRPVRTPSLHPCCCPLHAACTASPTRAPCGPRGTVWERAAAGHPGASAPPRPVACQPAAPGEPPHPQRAWAEAVVGAWADHLWAPLRQLDTDALAHVPCCRMIGVSAVGRKCNAFRGSCCRMVGVFAVGRKRNAYLRSWECYVRLS